MPTRTVDDSASPLSTGAFICQEAAVCEGADKGIVDRAARRQRCSQSTS